MIFRFLVLIMCEILSGYFGDLPTVHSPNIKPTLGLRLVWETYDTHTVPYALCTRAPTRQNLQIKKYNLLKNSIVHCCLESHNICFSLVDVNFQW